MRNCCRECALDFADMCDRWYKFFTGDANIRRQNGEHDAVVAQTNAAQACATLGFELRARLEKLPPRQICRCGRAHDERSRCGRCLDELRAAG